jgi:GTPase SAR1 family protein
LLKAQKKSFSDFARLRERVSNALASVAQCFDHIEAPDRAGQLERSRHAIDNDTFKVLLVGEFKRGKSTAINAMLGARVLPAKVAPCTAVITRVKFGETKQASLHARDSGAVTIVDLEADPTALTKSLVIEHVGDSADEDQSLSPYAFAEVTYPLELLRNHVELVDSPGLNEHATRTAVTHSFFSDADAMILVLSCAQFLSQSERKFLDVELAGRDLKDVFFLCNRYDAVRESPEDLEDLIHIAQQVLVPRVQGEPRLFFVAANEALAGKLNGKPELVEASKLPEFMNALETFLSTERGRVKLATPIHVCEHAIQEALLHIIPQREELFRLPLETLRQKLEQERPRLDEAERQCERAIRGVDRRAEAMVREAQASWLAFSAQLELGVERHAKTIDLSTWDAIRSKSETSKKLAAQLETWMGEQMRRWEHMQLQPLMETHWRDMMEDLDDQAAEFLENLAKVRAAFSVDSIDHAANQDVTAISRMLGAGLGLLNFGAMVEGAALGVGPAVKGLAVNLATVLVLKAMAFTLPVILPAVIGIGIVRTMAGAKQATDTIRENVVKQICAGLRKTQTNTETAIGRQILDMITPLRKRVSEQMTAMVEEIRGQVVEVIAERERSQVQVEDELARLKQIRETLTEQLRAVQGVLIELG